MKNTIIEGDVVDVLKTIDSNSFNLIIADPPYNIGKDFGVNRIFTDIDVWREWCQTWLKECVRILSDQGSIFVYGFHKYICYLQIDLLELDMNYGRMFIWYYENGFSGNTRAPASHYEPLLWFTKNSEYIYNPIREPYKSKERLKYKVIKDGKSWTPNPEGRLAGDVWSFPTLSGKRFENERTVHPTQKPLSISQRIVKHFSNQHDKVLVPFAGSGTECLASFIENREYLGIELNPEYIKIAEERMRKWDKDNRQMTFDLDGGIDDRKQN